MYPVLFSIGDFTVSTFGLMLAIAFLVGTWIASRMMEEKGLDPELATTLLIYVMLGGVGGSKLYYAIDVSIREDIPFTTLLFARDGITFYGGLIGGFLLGALGCRIHGVPVVTFANCAAVSLAVGQALGRVGCFLVGDDYGRVTDLPWGVAFPEGAPPTFETVHPTQLYEIAWLVPVAAFLWARRHKSPFLFGEYIALNGLGRIVVELWRTNQRIALGMTEAQWIGVTLIALGTSGWIYYQRRSVAVPA